jgi:hypothetical protein
MPAMGGAGGSGLRGWGKDGSAFGTMKARENPQDGGALRRKTRSQVWGTRPPYPRLEARGGSGSRVKGTRMVDLRLTFPRARDPPEGAPAATLGMA